MKLRGWWTVAAVLLVLVGVSGWLWAQEGSAVEGSAAPQAPAETEAEAEAEAEEEPPEMLKGYVCKIQMNRSGGRRMQKGTMEIAPGKMRREGVDGANRIIIVDGEKAITYAVQTRTMMTLQPTESGIPKEVLSQTHIAESYSWSGIQDYRRSQIDVALQSVRMSTRGQAGGNPRAQQQMAEAQAMTAEATLTKTDETKKMLGHSCVKYELSLPAKRFVGEVWVTKDIPADVKLGSLLAHSIEMGRGGLPPLAKLDEVEGFPVRISAEYYLPGRRNQRKMTFVIETAEAKEIEATRFELPEGTEVSEPLGMRGSFERSFRRGPGPEERRPEGGPPRGRR